MTDISFFLSVDYGLVIPFIDCAMDGYQQIHRSPRFHYQELINLIHSKLKNLLTIMFHVHNMSVEEGPRNSFM